MKAVQFEQHSGMLHRVAIRGFNLWVGRIHHAIVDPTARIAAKPCAVRRHREHGRKRARHRRHVGLVE
jgi:hypothetical protein